MTKEELKAFKKDLTQRQNKLQKESDKMFRKLEDRLKEIKEEASDSQSKILFSILLSRLQFENRYTNTMLENIYSVENEALKYDLLRIWNTFYPVVLEIRKDTKLYEAERERLGYISAITKTLNRYETTDKEFQDFLFSLENWKPAEIENGILYVNGKEIENGTVCGVKIGSGNRIHLMEVKISKRLNEKTNVEEDVITVYNGTRWYNSDIVIIDNEENIPKSILSKII